MQCRVCYGEEDTPTDPLLQPCLCKGTMSHVHASCLVDCRREARLRCPTCRAEYKTPYDGPESWPVDHGSWLSMFSCGFAFLELRLLLVFFESTMQYPDVLKCFMLITILVHLTEDVVAMRIPRLRYWKLIKAYYWYACVYMTCLFFVYLVTGEFTTLHEKISTHRR